MPCKRIQKLQRKTLIVISSESKCSNKILIEFKIIPKIRVNIEIKLNGLVNNFS